MIIQRDNQRPAWWTLIFTLFIGFVFLDPLQRQTSGIEWTLTVIGVTVFFLFFCIAILFWHNRRISLGAFAGVAILGFIFAPFNDGAAVFIIYATSFVPHAVAGNARLSAIIIGLILVIVGVESWLLNLTWVFWGMSAGYGVILGAGGTWAAQKSSAAERLAKIAERERIARDMHDVLGHTLSVIILKAELAGKLIDRDTERAKSEIGDVERISREALAEVRHTICGYRTEGLKVEFERAKSTLETAGVVVEYSSEKVDIPPTQESVLALMLREAVTNIVRHAQAKSCRIRLQQENNLYRLEIQDDGQGGQMVEGSGLRGMRERVEALGGKLLYEADSGTKLTVILPLSSNTTGNR